VALDVSRALRLGDVSLFTSSLPDPVVVVVRIEAVRGLVSLDAAAVLAGASADAEREVRVAVAAGLGTIGDPLVRAAALTAAADLGTGGDLARLAESGLADPAWQVRRGALRTRRTDSDADVRAYTRMALGG